ncbi:MAG: ferrous iron transport protein A [Vicinamibacterales bacterium]
MAISQGIVRLADVEAGTTVRMSDARLEPGSRALLRALGLTDGSVLRVCKQGEPCVVQVRTTRIGLSSRVARDVFILPIEAPPAGGPAA